MHRCSMFHASPWGSLDLSEGGTGIDFGPGPGPEAIPDIPGPLKLNLELLCKPAV